VDIFRLIDRRSNLRASVENQNFRTLSNIRNNRLISLHVSPFSVVDGRVLKQEIFVAKVRLTAVGTLSAGMSAFSNLGEFF